MADPTAAVNPSWQKAQNALDKLAHLNILALPDPNKTNTPHYGSNAFTGTRINAGGHRLDIEQQAPTSEDLRARNTVGPKEADIGFDLSLAPDDFLIGPDKAIPTTGLDLSKNQRIALNNFSVRFADGSGFQGFGGGLSYPLHDGTDKFRVGAMGTLTNGTGNLTGANGMWVMTGYYEVSGKYHFNILVMLINPGSNIKSDTPVAAIDDAISNPVPASTFHTFHTYVPGDVVVPFKFFQGNPMGLHAPETMTLCNNGFTTKGAGGLKCSGGVGTETLGDHPLDTTFFMTRSKTLGQIPTDPVNFNVRETWTFKPGGVEMGSFDLNVDEGRAFFTAIKDIDMNTKPQMFAGFGPISKGSGKLGGIEGLQANVGVGTMAPHWTSITYLFDLSDPTGKYRTT